MSFCIYTNKKLETKSIYKTIRAGTLPFRLRFQKILLIASHKVVFTQLEGCPTETGAKVSLMVSNITMDQPKYPNIVTTIERQVGYMSFFLLKKEKGNNVLLFIDIMKSVQC